MKLKRIVADMATDNLGAARRFYQDVLGLGLLMDQGWIATYGSTEMMNVQISFASQGGSDQARLCPSSRMEGACLVATASS
jgi:hypothetical protein